MITLINSALSRARTVFIILFLILLSGTVAYLTIPKESQPDIDIPIMMISVGHGGISPEDSERLIVRPMEKRLSTVDGLSKITATGGEGFANLVLEFDAGFDADQALLDVQEQVDLAKRDLPGDSNDPVITEINVGLFPVVVVALYGNVPERTLLAVAQRLKNEFETLPTVQEAGISGDREELVEILVSPSLMESYNVSPLQVVQTVTSNNRLIAAGALEDERGRLAVTVPGLIRTADELFGLPVIVRGDTVVTLGDVTEVRRTFKDRNNYARFNGQPAIMIDITKKLGENVILTVAGVRAIVDGAIALDLLPPGVQVELIQDQSEEIKIMVNDLQNSVIIAVVLVMIIVIGALGLRTAGLVGIAIPGSFLTGILILQFLDLTLNFVVLFSLILSVGLVIDGAIVITEFADRKMAEGINKLEAYGAAARRMAWPIIASNATTLAAFLPLLFWPGIVGEFMKFLPITMIATLIGSLAMALIFIPTLGSRLGQSGSADPRVLKALAAAESGDLDEIRGITRPYVAMLWALVRFPAFVVLGAISMLAGAGYLYGTFGNGIEFFPETEPSSLVVYVHARGNLSVTEKDGLLAEVERQVLQVRGIKSASARSGVSGDGAAGSGDVIGRISLALLDWDVRPPASEILDEITERTRHIAGITVDFQQASTGPTTGRPVQIEVSALDPVKIDPALELLLAKMNSMEGLTNVDDSRPIPGIEWQLVVDRTQAGIYGADVTTVGNMVKLVTTGIVVSSYRPDDAIEELDITVRYPASDRNIDQLDNLRIMTPRGMVPVSNFVTRTPVPKVGNVVRVDGRRVISVGADVADGFLSDTMVTELRAWLTAAPIDPDVQIAFRGEDADLQEAQAFLSQAFLVALFIMAIILVTQFNSFYQAFIILTAVMLSTTGVFLGLLIADMPFGVIMSGVGVITLAGVVVNNNIVLIDTYNHLKKKFPPMEAIVRTGAQRLRPVFLTATVTILALTPMVFGFNVDLISREVAIGAPSTALWQQLAIAVVSGLVFAAPFTLIVTPCLLALGVQVSNLRMFGGKGKRAKVDPDPVPSGVLAAAGVGDLTTPSGPAGDIAPAGDAAPAE